MTDPVEALAGAVAVPDLGRRELVLRRLEGRADLGRLLELAAWSASVAPLLTGEAGDHDPAGPDAVVVVPPETARAGGVQDSLDGGCAAADRVADEGRRLAVLHGDDLVAARALASAFLDLDPVPALGWPQRSGSRMVPADADWADQVRALQSRRRTTAASGRASPPAALLEGLGEPAWLCGFLLRCAARTTPVLLDGESALAAAVLCRWVAPGAGLWWQVADRPGSVTAAALLAELDLVPILGLGVDTSEVAAGRLAVPVLAEAAVLAAGCLTGGSLAGAEQTRRDDDGG